MSLSQWQRHVFEQDKNSESRKVEHQTSLRAKFPKIFGGLGSCSTGRLRNRPIKTGDSYPWVRRG